MRHLIVLPEIADIFDLPLAPMSKSVQTSPAVLLDPTNVGAYFGILLISCTEAEVLRCFISTARFWRPSVICDSRKIAH